jgi:hypothetical protein
VAVGGALFHSHCLIVVPSGAALLLQWEDLILHDKDIDLAVLNPDWPTPQIAKRCSDVLAKASDT